MAAAAQAASDDTSTGGNELVASGATPAASDAGAAAGEPPVNNPPTQTAAQTQSSPVPISSLKRLKYVAPKYPRAAERRNLSGWVDVIFTVASDGSVKDVEVRNSEPGETFVNAAVRAVEKWEFEPVEENGRIVEKRAGVRMMFALE